MKQYYVIVALCMLAFSAWAQPQRFKAGIIAGINASQVDGDDLGGYHRLGLRGGLRGTTILNEKMEILIEILYSQRGAQAQLKDTRFLDRPVLQLNYVEVPVLFNYLDWLVEDDDGNSYAKMNFTGGLSYGRLLRATAEGTFIKPIAPNVDKFNRDDISIVLGGTFMAYEHWGITVRYNRSLNNLFRYTENGNNWRLKGYFLNFDILYMF